MTTFLQALARLGDSLVSWIPAMIASTGLVLAAAAVLDWRLGPRLGAGWRVLPYLAVFARLALPAGWQSPVGVLPTTPDTADPAPALDAPVSAAGAGTEALASLPNAPVAAAPAASSVPAARAVVAEPVAVASTGGGGAPAGPVFAAASPASNDGAHEVWLALAAAIYLLGAAVLVGRWHLGRRRLQRALRGCPAAPGDVEALAGAPVRLHPTLGPLVAGVLRPVVVLPAPLLAALDPPALAAVLAHERAHVRRGDPLLTAGVQLACALAWPVLPLWLAARRLRTLIELACDERALRGRSSEDRRRYGALLLALAEGELPLGEGAPVPSFNLDLRARLRALAHRRRLRGAVQLAVILPVTFGALAASGRGIDPPRPAPEAKVAAPVGEGAQGDRVAELLRVVYARELRDTHVDGPGLTKEDFVRQLYSADAVVEQFQSLFRRGRLEELLARMPPEQASHFRFSIANSARFMSFRRYGESNSPFWCAEAEQGAYDLRLVIEPDGHVSSARVERTQMSHPEAGDCLVERIRRLRFTRAPGGRAVTVRHVFQLPVEGRIFVEGFGLPLPTIRAELRARLADLKACGFDEAATNPSFRRSAILTFRIETNGTATPLEIEAGRARPSFETCMNAAVRTLRFPPPQDAAALTVRYPITIELAGPRKPVGSPSPGASTPAPGPTTVPPPAAPRAALAFPTLPALVTRTKVQGALSAEAVIAAMFNIGPEDAAALEDDARGDDGSGLALLMEGAPPFSDRRRPLGLCVRAHGGEGPVELRFVVGPDGRAADVRTPRAATPGGALAGCLKDRLSKVEFTKPADSRPVEVTHLFVPPVTLGRAQFLGFGLPPAAIRERVRARLPDLKACGEEEIRRDPHFDRSARLRFVIDASGRAGEVTLSRADRGSLATCLAKVLAPVEFPAPADGSPVTVTWPLVFEHRGSAGRGI